MTKRLDLVRSLVAQDYTNDEIARELGLKSDRQVMRLKRQAGVEMQEQHYVNQEMRDEIARLSGEEGWPPEEIMATLGVNKDAIRRYAVQGPGREWSAIASALAVRHRALWNELRGHR